MKLNEILKRFTEALENEFVVPFFPGFYYSAFDKGNEDVEWDIFNDPNSVPEEILNFCCSDALEEDTKTYRNDVGAAFVEEFNNQMAEILPGFTSEMVEIESPREYNFETDRLIAKTDLSLYLPKIKEYLDKNKEAFKAYVKKRHSSYDGFISFYSDDADEWDLDNLDYNELCTVFGFMLTNKGITADMIIDEVVDQTIILPRWVNMDAVREQFKFDVPPEEQADLENYEEEPVDGVYIRKNEDVE